jgi:hypothetical protein
MMETDPYPEDGFWKKTKGFKLPKIIVIFTFFCFVSIY